MVRGPVSQFVIGEAIMKKLSKAFYLTYPIVSFVCVFFIGIFAFAVLSASSLNDVAATALFFLVLAILGTMYACVVYFVFIYKIWDAIADEHARTTPGKAVGFLFIPFYNFYWIFQVVHGFAKDCNAYIERRGLHAEKLPEGLFLTCAILQVCAAIPYLGFLSALAYLVVSAIVISKTCDTVNAFDGDPRRGQGNNEQKGKLALHFLTGEFTNSSLELPPNGLTIGRDPSRANLILSSPKISSLHARLTPNGNDQVMVEDLNSMNGTFYRQQRMGGGNVGWEWVPLRGQTLLAAGTRLRLADADEFEIR